MAGKEKQLAIRLKVLGSEAGLKEIEKLDKEIFGLTASQKALRKELSTPGIDKAAYDEFSTQLSRLNVRLGQLKQQRREAVRDNQLEANAIREAANSYNELAAQTTLLERRLKRLPDASEAFKSEIAATVEANRQELKSMDRSIESSKNLVGDYENSIINAFSKVDLTERLKKKFDELGQTETELISETKKLAREYDRLEKEGGEAFRKVEEELLTNSTALDQLQSELKQTRRELERTGDLGEDAGNQIRSSFDNLTNTLLAGFGLFKAQELFENFIRLNADASDALSDVQKTTKLTKDEVNELTEALKLRDTRTNLTDQLGIAEIGGQLGIAKEDLLGFTESVDKTFVALKKELGGTVEEVATDLGKINDVFNIAETLGVGEGINAIGSAINELGASGTANAGKIVDFTKRLGGIAPQAKIAVPDVLGLAAALDQMGQSPEVASTALSKLLITIGSDVPKFAKIAGVSVKEFSELLRTDGNKAFLAVLKGAKSSGVGLEELQKTLEQLGVKQARAAGVLGALTSDIGLIEEKQKLANKAFAEGTSLTEEFNIKNQNLAAEIAKLKRSVTEFFIEADFQEFFAGAISIGREFVDFLKVHKGILSILTIATVAFIATRFKSIAAWTLEATVVKGVTIAEKGLAASKAFLTGAYNLLTGRVKIATITQAAYNAVLAVNPVVAVGTAIAALTVAYFALRSEVEDNIKVKKTFDKVSERFQSNLTDESSKAKALLEQLKRTNPESAEFERLRVQLNTTYKDYLPNLVTERASLGEILEAERNINRELIKKAALKTRQEEITAATEEFIKKQAELKSLLVDQFGLSEELAQAELERSQKINDATTQNNDLQKENIDLSKTRLATAEDLAAAETAFSEQDRAQLKKAGQTLVETENGLKSLSSVLTEAKESNDSYNKTVSEIISLTDNLIPKVNEAGNAVTDYGNAADTAQKLQDEFNKTLLSFRNKFLDLESKNLEESRERELSIERRAYRKKKEAQEAALTTALENEKLNGEQRQELTDASDDLIEALAEAHRLKLQTINAKWDKSDLEARDKALEQKLKQVDNEASKETAAIDQSRREQRKIIEADFLNKAISLDRFTKKSEKINRKAAIERLDIERDRIKKELQIIEDSFPEFTASLSSEVDATAEQSEEIIALKLELAQRLREIDEDYFEYKADQRETDKEAQLESIQRAEEINGQIFDIVTGIAEVSTNKKVGLLQTEREAVEAHIQDLERKALRADKDERKRINRQIAFEKEKVEDLNAAIEEEERSLARTQKTIAITNATINTALAVTKALAQTGDFTGITAALIAAQGAVQIALIASTPLAEGGSIGDTDGGHLQVISGGQIPQAGGEIKGRRHSSNPANDGVQFRHKGKRFTAEGGELLIHNGSEKYVLTRGVAVNPQLRAWASALNVAGGGRSFAGGGSITDTSFADGGSILGTPLLFGDVSPGSDNQLKELLVSQSEMIEATNGRIDRIEVVNKLDDFNDEDSRDKAIESITTL